MNYIACSEESEEGFCPYVYAQKQNHEQEYKHNHNDNDDSTCSAIDICRTCSRDENGKGFCEAIHYFPNATVAEYGSYSTVSSNDTVYDIMAEIYVRGPVQASVNGTAIKDYTGGIIDDVRFENIGHNHGVSIVGWGEEEVIGNGDGDGTNENNIGRDRKRKYWIVRNSWGQYWGEMGFFRVEMGRNLIGIENHIAWATPGVYSTINYPCAEDGERCNERQTMTMQSITYIDPSRLRRGSSRDAGSRSVATRGARNSAWKI